MRYLVDTDWVIHYLRGSQNVVDRLDELASQGLSVSVISLAELYQGVFHSGDPVGDELELLSFLSDVEVLPLTDEICRLFGAERGRLKSVGTPIGDFDLLIGCTAVQLGLTVLTNNRRHFERIANITLETTSSELGS